MNKKKITRLQKVGLGMILLSCILYVLLPFNMCLPFSACIITGVSAIMWGSSEILFYAGGAILGKNFMDALKKKVSLKRFLCNHIHKKEKK